MLLKIVLLVLIFFALFNWVEYRAIMHAYKKNGLIGAINMVLAYTIHKIASLWAA